ncbi:hypothetical protein [Cod iridovirus]|uniref:Uncharacterized protein n=1 Tax=Cod iridovirus TaxID=1887316 RepID=A0A1B2ITZ8_FRG3V|nr:hypothetical protein [Cod iridovirus]
MFATKMLVTRKPFISHKIFMVVRLAVRAKMPKDSLARDSLPKDSLAIDFISPKTLSLETFFQTRHRLQMALSHQTGYLLKIVTAVDSVHLT